ncbi:concanavalin A-like lectin/glucanase [Parathielavia hyrcaniae]|uniref:Concanavalin A-like lectin/glucanase n=1 Tax=Parathielavia hyrcaniae TaxID=113614 RepID=A0AAN6T3Q8_9PEZI|nr:concanavalin A-like lectin/glucanase [Parathielavia hyrcaniae]
MKSTNPLLALLATAITCTSSATIPLPPTRPRDVTTPHQLRLLHTLTPSSPPSHHRLLTTTTTADDDSNSDSTTESTKGGAVLTLTSDNYSNEEEEEEEARIASVHATFRIPHADPPTTGPTAGNPVGLYAASFWVGIDSVASFESSSCTGTGGGSLRAGVDIFFDGTLGGQQSPFAWYQFASAESGSGSGDATGLEGFGVVPGDLVRFTLSADTSESAEVVVLAENFGGNVGCAEGATAVVTVRTVLPAGGGEGGLVLCGREAAWVVEDFPLAGMLEFPIALANFTSVTFGAAGVTLEDGSERDVTGAEVRDVRLEAQGGRLTSCEVVDGKKVKCTRVLGDD